MKNIEKYTLFGLGVLKCIAVIVSLVSLLPVERAGAEEYPVRAPDVLPGTTEDMLSPFYWINRIDNPDEVIMTFSMIESFNEKNASRAISPDHPYAEHIADIEKEGPVFNILDPLGISESLSGSTIIERLKENVERLTKSALYDRWGLPFTDKKKAEIRTNINLDGVRKAIRPKTGMIVHHTSVRLYPTAEPGYLMRGYLDNINVTSLDVGMPVAIIHTSENTEYLFVMSPIAWGWVHAGAIAFCSQKDIREFRETDNLIVAVDHKVTVYADSSFSTYSGSLYMGEKLPYAHKTARGYSVIVPERDFDGTLRLRDGWIRNDAVVNEGWLHYTKGNVITVAFRLLGRPYGWHDSWDENDCGGIMRVIFNCFGITLPRYWSFQQLYSDHATFVGDMEDAAKKTALLATMPAGITFTGTSGHIGLYLGIVDGKPYCINQCGWNYKEGDTEYKMARVVVSDFEHIGFNFKALKFFTPVMP